MELAKTDYYTITRGTGAGILTLTWNEQSSEMKDPDYKEGLSRFASLAGEYRSAHLLKDMSHLSFQPSELTLEWREQTIVRQYNAAGVKKLAFVWGEDAEVPPDYDYADPAEHFVTKNFATKEQARDWLLGY